MQHGLWVETSPNALHLSQLAGRRNLVGVMRKSRMTQSPIALGVESFLSENRIPPKGDAWKILKTRIWSYWTIALMRSISTTMVQAADSHAVVLRLALGTLG